MVGMINNIKINAFSVVWSIELKKGKQNCLWNLLTNKLTKNTNNINLCSNVIKDPICCSHYFICMGLNLITQFMLLFKIQFQNIVYHYFFIL